MEETPNMLMLKATGPNLTENYWFLNYTHIHTHTHTQQTEWHTACPLKARGPAEVDSSYEPYILMTGSMNTLQGSLSTKHLVLHINVVSSNVQQLFLKVVKEKWRKYTQMIKRYLNTVLE